MKIAAILTCYNRKEKTISCLNGLFTALNYFNNKNKVEDPIKLSVYLTDDGCTDGTATVVREKFEKRNIIILQGDGDLYWAGGMRFAWKEALKQDFDFYLLLNDDTNVTNTVFEELFETHDYCLKKFNAAGIYSGCTCSKNNSQKVTYGGDVMVNRFLATSKRLSPNGKPQLCDVANGNILLIPKSIVNHIGIFCDKYTHRMADYDYTLTARKNGIPILITSYFCGECDNDHQYNYKEFAELNYSKRKQYLNSPLRSAKDYLIYIKRHFLFRYPIVYLGYISKLFFPKLYLFLDRRRYQ